MPKVKKQVRTVDPTDVVQNHLFRHHPTPPSSFTAAVQATMSLRANDARRFLKDLVKESIEAPSSAIVVRLAAAYLVQLEMKHRLANDFASSLLPFTLGDYHNALEYAKANESKYIGVEDDEETDEEGQKKRGRKGGTFDKIRDYLLDHPEMLEKAFKAADAVTVLVEELEIPENTCLQYLYKCRRLHKTGELE
tara:strand:+ start:2338 stop:2919 length:582 start_codon:yes stop_codon:yes gene_type:complete